MDTLKQINLEQAIIRVLQDCLEFVGNEPDSDLQLVLDGDRKHYLLVEAGWDNHRRIYGSLIHLDLIDNKIWIQQDGTETGVANDLLSQGVSPQQIVLAFKSPERRRITDFAVY